MENPGIDPGISRMQSGGSIIWAKPHKWITFRERWSASLGVIGQVLFTSELANQRARKVLFTCVVYTNSIDNITKAKRVLWLANSASTICPSVYTADVLNN